MIDHLQAPIGRNNINVVGFQMLPSADLDDRHARARSDDVHQFAAMLWVQMHDDDERCAGVVWNGSEKALQRVHASR
jgi:hypothetical protein